MNKERMLFALGEIDDKYIKEAEPNPMKQRNRIIAVAVSLALVVALSLYLFIPFRDAVSDLSDYKSSAYYPLIETIDDYYLSLRNQTSYKNYFEYYTDMLGGLFAPMKDAAGSAPPPMDNMAGAPEMMPDGGTGEYVENTDNQVEGVIESDLMKMTDKYIFRLGYRIEKGENGKYSSVITLLRVYSIDKEETDVVAEIDLPTFEDENYRYSVYTNHEMYLSTDADTITILKEYRSSESSQTRLGVIALDVTDVTNITERGKVSIDGSLNTSRLVDGKLILISDYSVAKSRVDYDIPETFVPTVDSGEGREAIGMTDVIYPEEISNTQYTVVTMMDSENLEIFGTKALLNFTSDVYVSKNHLFLSREYTEKNGNESHRKSDIAVLDYTGEELVDKGIITARGWTEDQYSFDEKDGYLRVVTSTLDTKEWKDEGGYTRREISESASLYIFSLADNSLAYKVEDFAPQGESATAVRFDGDSCYVCTAVVVTFTDPVYFFDLSDYENITYTDTGVIEGYSTSLIQLGDGFLLGIGEENRTYSKVEVFEERDGDVVAVDKYFFEGEYSTEYKSYLIDREKDLFGFGVSYFFNEETGKCENMYVLLAFNGYELVEVAKVEMYFNDASRVRAVIIDDYLYITDDTQIKFVSLVNG